MNNLSLNVLVCCSTRQERPSVDRRDRVPGGQLIERRSLGNCPILALRQGVLNDATFRTPCLRPPQACQRDFCFLICRDSSPLMGVETDR